MMITESIIQQNFVSSVTINKESLNDEHDKTLSKRQTECYAI